MRSASAITNTRRSRLERAQRRLADHLRCARRRPARRARRAARPRLRSGCTPDSTRRSASRRIGGALARSARPRTPARPRACRSPGGRERGRRARPSSRSAASSAMRACWLVPRPPPRPSVRGTRTSASTCSWTSPLAGARGVDPHVAVGVAFGKLLVGGRDRALELLALVLEAIRSPRRRARGRRRRPPAGR